MTIYKTVQEDLRRYTFIEKVEILRGYVYIYYDKEKYKRITYRASIPRLIKLIEKIKKKLDMKKKKK